MFNVAITQLTLKGRWVLRSHFTEDTREDADARVARSIQFYRERGYAVRWRITHNHEEVDSGAWGLDGDDWAEPPTVGNQVI